MNGANTIGQQPSYGTRGTASTTNVPGAREGSVSMVDTGGDLWLFGGTGYDSAGTFDALGDLWMYTAGKWTWMSGPQTADQAGVYGTLGTAATGNSPGGRSGAVGAADHAGDLFVFGGKGYDSAGSLGLLSDLWMYTAGKWTWLNGPNVVSQKGVYGTLKTPAAGNVPGARTNAVTWVDTSEDVMVFGGQGYDSAGTVDLLNDLWIYSGGKWAWFSGSNVVNQRGVYGTVGQASLANVPGARSGAMSYIDSAGDLWLFGGYGYDSAGNLGELDDLWMFSAGKWTWISGASVINPKGIYTTVGGPGIPGGRQLGAFWVDSTSTIWQFGGYGYDAAGNLGLLNDLWLY
jgi:N-acetylneuraminic acid mutarotase